MGKSPAAKRLNILVDAEWLKHPKILKLIEKGHNVSDVETSHLILSKSAHMWSDDMWSLLEVTLKAARARKKGLDESDHQDN